MSQIERFFLSILSIFFLNYIFKLFYRSTRLLLDRPSQLGYIKTIFIRFNFKLMLDKKWGREIFY